MRFCTSASVFELPHARVLADRIAEHHPGATLTVLLSGRPTLGDDEPFAAVAGGDIGFTAFTEAVARHERSDLELLLRPHLLRHLLEDGDDPLVYLHAAHELLAPLDTVAEALERHPVVLSPRLRGTLPDDGREPNAEDLREHGRIDPGFVAVRPGADAEAFLEWWATRSSEMVPYLAGTRGAGIPAQGRRQLRHLLDVAPSRFPALGQLDDAGTEVSCWNLHERPLTREDGVISAGGRPLRSLSLEGFGPERPYLLSRRATRVAPSTDPVLRELLDEYTERLIARGWVDLPRRSEVGRRLANGTVFTDRLLRLYVEALAGGEELGDIFSPEGTERFVAWLTEPFGTGAQAGMSRYLHRTYRDRPDLPIAYPDLDGADGVEFAAWCWVFGRRELDIPDDFLPPKPAHVDVPEPGAASITVDVAGYFTGTLGLGEAARLYVQALRAAQVPVRTTTVDAQLPTGSRRRRDAGYGQLDFEELRHAEKADVNLICVNAEELPRFVADAGPELLAGKRNIGVWAWETDVVPARWDPAFDHLDEIWVYSRYIAENLGRVSPIPVVPIPPPITPPPAGDEPELGLPEGFRFMFMFDFFSTVKRKNPIGVVEAFKRAFAPGEGPQLVVKTIHAEHRRADYEQLAFAAEGRPDIHIVDSSLSVAAKNGLLASCDCYVSLHRSEGYGLPLAECMAMGKPVIATAFSGNLDFMSAANSYPVNYTLTQVGGDVEIYPAEGTWAEPDLGHAAAQMRAVWQDPDEARRRGARAAADIAEHLSPEHVGGIARARLERSIALAAAPAAPAPQPARDGAALAEVQRHLRYDFAGGAPGPLGAGRVARRLLLRALRPFTVHERALDRAVGQALDEVTTELAAQRRELECLRTTAEGRPDAG